MKVGLQGDLGIIKLYVLCWFVVLPQAPLRVSRGMESYGANAVPAYISPKKLEGALATI
jgi:hypothetical protein